MSRRNVKISFSGKKSTFVLSKSRLSLQEFSGHYFKIMANFNSRKHVFFDTIPVYMILRVS